MEMCGLGLAVPVRLTKVDETKGFRPMPNVCIIGMANEESAVLIFLLRPISLQRHDFSFLV